MADPVLKQLRQDLADAQTELKAATKARQKAEKEKQKAETAYNNAVVKKQQAYDNLQNAQDDLQRAESDLKTAVRDAAKTVSDLLAEAANLESTWQAQKTSFDAGKIDNFPEALGEDIDALSVNADSFFPDFDAFERAISSAKKAVSTAKANVTKADNAYAKRDAELQSANTALTQAIADEDAAQKKVDAAQDAVNNYKPSPFAVTYGSSAYKQRIVQANADIPRLTAALQQAQAADAAQGLTSPSLATQFAQFRLTDAQEIAKGAHTPANPVKNFTPIPITGSSTTSQQMRNEGFDADDWTENGNFPYVFDRPNGADDIHDIFDKSCPDAHIGDEIQNADVRAYTSNYGYDLNYALLGIRPMTPAYAKSINDAKQQLNTCCLPANMTILRGLKRDYGKYVASLKSGDIFVHKNFASTTIDFSVAQNNFDGECILVIRATVGVNCMEVSKISHFSHECEILFPPGLVLYVDRVETGNHGQRLVICHTI